MSQCLRGHEHVIVSGRKTCRVCRNLAMKRFKKRSRQKQRDIWLRYARRRRGVDPITGA